MNNSNSISKSDLAQLDNKFDIDIAGLNSLLDKVLDKTPGYAPQKNYANISSNQTPNQSNQAGGSQQSTPQTQTLKSRDNGQSTLQFFCL